jgi:hypothetical protein
MPLRGSVFPWARRTAAPLITVRGGVASLPVGIPLVSGARNSADMPVRTVDAGSALGVAFAAQPQEEDRSDEGGQLNEATSRGCGFGSRARINGWRYRIRGGGKGSTEPTGQHQYHGGFGSR